MPILVDLEATCADDGSLARSEMEIIEIGAVAVSADGVVPFSVFVRPTRHPRLTPFCTALTSITQEDVDAAEDFRGASRRFADFVSTYAEPNDWWGSWGDYDRNQLGHDVRRHGVPTPVPLPHRNLKQEFTERQGLRKRPGLDDAIHLAGLDFLGSHHRGVDDARNIAQLLPWILGDERVGPRRVTAWGREMKLRKRR